ncbi:T9SS sorting signal type C domain-containing protein [Flavobacterium fluviatile]|uniref:glycine-rich domain-containing protein n=1 Tax=Flavobacterium fluviatile TaxID=1862387 RepID=UPI0013D44708|nr:T9SS sorting signal type C domain-containing protein [Flavobacterium fluviatile]
MRIKLSFLLFFVFSSIWAQPPHTYTTPGNGTFKVPAGVTSLNVECWGGGGAGGGTQTPALISLFGGGGGGGGAYSRSATFVVTPATTLNYKVGAGGVGINGADGPNGENTNFSTVTANGGTGGKNGNSANGAGGAGGTSSGVGSFAGGNGYAGGLVGAIVQVLSSGGGGGSAGPGAGSGANGNNATPQLLYIAGGAAVTGGGKGGDGITLALASGGNSGNAPGGGGAGALGLVGGNYKGGNGGNGQIKITYTCPTYALTSPTTANDVCTAIGTSSLVRLTGGASLPNGDYVVTYNRSNPAATGLTATMSVTGGTGTGTFTAVGLSAAGSSTITITNLTSESCTNTINANNSVTVNVYSASTGGTVSGGTSVCSGSTSGLLTLAGHTGSVVRWEYGVEVFSVVSWTPIPNTATTYTSGPLTETTHFRAIIKNGACSETASVATIVTVNPLPAITTTGTLDNICFDTSSQLASLPYSATTNTPVNYSIVWDSAAIAAGFTNQGTTAFSFLSGGGNLNTITIPAGILPNTYTGTMTIQNANCSSTRAIQLTIVPRPAAPITGIITQPTCVTPTGSVTLSGLPVSTPSNVDITIVQNGSSLANFTIAPTATHTISGLNPGTYNYTVHYAGSCISPISLNVVVNNLVTNTYNGSWSNGTPTMNHNLIFTSNYSSAGGGLGNITGCSCMVNSGVDVVINSNDTLIIQNAVVNNGGTLTFENNASLVQNNAAAVNWGNIVYKRITAPMKNFDFTYWSSPVAGQTLYNLSPNTRWDKYLSYTGTVWREEQYGASDMTPGIGYIIRTPSEGTWPNGEHVSFPYSQEVEFIGIPNNGNIAGQSVTAGNYYLIGNPYPSAISADAFLFADSNNNAILDGTIYFWTHNTPIQMMGTKPAYTSDDYASYNGVGGTSTSRAPSGGAEPAGTIGAGQSFFALASANGTVMFNNGMRIQGNNNQFFKPAKPNILEKHRVWLNMTNKDGAFKQLLIGYVEGATNGYDSDYDGITFDGNAYIDFYSIDQGSNLVIQGRAVPFDDSDIVPLGYRSNIAGDFTIAIEKSDGILSNHPVYLEDKLTHTITDLSQNDYIFNSSTGIFNNRFMIKFTNTTLAANRTEHNNDVVAWFDNMTLKLNSSGEIINKVFIHDISGKLVYSDSDISSSEVSISNLKFKNELLLIKIVLADNNVVNKKIVTASE